MSTINIEKTDRDWYHRGQIFQNSTRHFLHLWPGANCLGYRGTCVWRPTSTPSYSVLSGGSSSSDSLTGVLWLGASSIQASWFSPFWIWICQKLLFIHRSAWTDSLALLPPHRLHLPLSLPGREDHLRDLPGDDLRKGLHSPDSQPCQRSEQKDNDWVPVLPPHCQRLQPLLLLQGDSLFKKSYKKKHVAKKVVWKVRQYMRGICPNQQMTTLGRCRKNLILDPDPWSWTGTGGTWSPSRRIHDTSWPGLCSGKPELLER